MYILYWIHICMYCIHFTHVYVCIVYWNGISFYPGRLEPGLGGIKFKVILHNRPNPGTK